MVIVCCVYKRYELTRIVLNYYKELQPKYPIQLLCCGSDDESRKIARECGWDYEHHRNEPLNFKHNQLFRAARQYNKPVMLIGSDDLISAEIIEYYLKRPDNLKYVIGFNTLHFYSVSDKRLIYFKGYPEDHTGRVTMGAGRYFPVSVLQKINYEPFMGKNPRKAFNSGMDTLTSRLLIRYGIDEAEIMLPEIPGAMIVDIKTETNITTFDRVLLNCNECDVAEVFERFPNEMKLISELK